ncbi:hypothetical protein [Mycoavidus cysteinexigens]|nr:hypothetical protein [Mycoavidus cysteinexigens]
MQLCPKAEQTLTPAIEAPAVIHPKLGLEFFLLLPRIGMRMTEFKRDEGERFKPYFDTVGKITIGVGRNLTDGSVSQGECELLLQNDIAKRLDGLIGSRPTSTALL